MSSKKSQGGHQIAIVDKNVKMEDSPKVPPLVMESMLEMMCDSLAPE